MAIVLFLVTMKATSTSRGAAHAAASLRCISLINALRYSKVLKQYRFLDKTICEIYKVKQFHHYDGT